MLDATDDADVATLLASFSERGVQVVRGQHHEFMLIPLLEHHSRWFEAGPICFAVEARALGNDPAKLVRGPSIHVFSADRTREFIRFDLFGVEQHYHYILNDAQHNVVWGYDPDANGPMLDWVIASLRARLPAMLRRAGEDALADRVECEGWDTSVLAQIEQAARDADRPTDDELERAREGFAWMVDWKRRHPQFNTVDH